MVLAANRGTQRSQQTSMWQPTRPQSPKVPLKSKWRRSLIVFALRSVVDRVHSLLSWTLVVALKLLLLLVAVQTKKVTLSHHVVDLQVLKLKRRSKRRKKNSIERMRTRRKRMKMMSKRKPTDRSRRPKMTKRRLSKTKRGQLTRNSMLKKRRLRLRLMQLKRRLSPS